jgi:hypothetical protein
MNSLVREKLSHCIVDFEPNDFAIDECVPSDPTDSIRCDSPRVGVLWGLDERGAPLVLIDEIYEAKPIPARSVVPLTSADIGREVVALFEQYDPARPLIMGIIRAPRKEPVRTEIDAEKLVFTAEREIVLRCGEASITLTRAGKVLIEGAYVLTKAAGMNRVKGAAVQIN